MQCKRGSITIFSLLSLLLITATLFALLEGTRLQELRRFAGLQTLTALESGFANYNTCLWQTYHLLGTEQAEMKEILQEGANGRNASGTNFLRLKPEKIEVVGDTRFTDQNGRVFIGCVAAYMNENFVYEATKEVYSQYEAIKHLMDENQMDISDIGEALKELETAEVTSSHGTAASRNREKQLDVKALLEVAKRWQEMGILELVIEDTNALSKEKCDFSNGLLQRELETGENRSEVSIDWKARILMQQYLLTYMSGFQSEQKGRALVYELEYLLGQKSSDIENLKVVAVKLLAIREAVNFLFLISNPDKTAQAEAMAALLAGATLNPVLLSAVKMGLLTAWALAESILDVRAILAGKRIALLKSEETWTSELENISDMTNGFAMAKESLWGLTYENYLGVLLLLEKEETLAMRAMNVQEAAIRKTDSNTSFRMDALLTQTSVKITYSYKPIFPFLQEINADERWEYRVWATQNYGYY